MNDPLLTLVARAVLEQEAKMAELAGLREAVSRIAGVMADMQAQIAAASPEAISAAVAAALAERDAAVEAEKADAVNAALAEHDAAVQAQIDAIAADVNAIVPA